MTIEGAVEPSTGLAGLCWAITIALVFALPAGRWIAGLRSGEPREAARAGTVRVAIGMLVWVGLTGAVAGAGLLSNFDSVPPPAMPMLLATFVLVFGVAFSRLGLLLARHLPLWLLVGYQSFRVAVEYMLHRAAGEGVIGAHMTWSGLNYDVATGVTALALGLWLLLRGDDRPDPRGLTWTWNVLGLGLLLTIVTIAVLSIPGPLRYFDGPPNVWIATVPFVWLPTVMVAAALLGHLLVIRRLLTKP